MKKCLLMMVTVCLFALSGCETMQGMGKDLQKLGGAIEKKAKDTE